MENETSNKSNNPDKKLRTKTIITWVTGAFVFLATILALITDGFTIHDRFYKSHPEKEISNPIDTNTNHRITTPVDSSPLIAKEEETKPEERQGPAIENIKSGTVDTTKIIRTHIKILPAINDLKPKNELPKETINTNNPVTIGTKSEDDFNTIATSEMRKAECEVLFNTTIFYYGQACFENKTENDLIISIPESFVGIPDQGLQGIKVFLPKGGKNCFPKVIVSLKSEVTVRDMPYTFTTVNTPLKKTTKITVSLETCKLKSVKLTERNVYFQ